CARWDYYSNSWFTYW
nr:immunoglobulin heavy chain junction region [Mus musculus]